MLSAWAHVKNIWVLVLKKYSRTSLLHFMREHTRKMGQPEKYYIPENAQKCSYETNSVS